MEIVAGCGAKNVHKMKNERDRATDRGMCDTGKGLGGDG